jgi:hypothetical protein
VGFVAARDLHGEVINYVEAVPLGTDGPWYGAAATTMSHLIEGEDVSARLHVLLLEATDHLHDVVVDRNLAVDHLRGDFQLSGAFASSSSSASASACSSSETDGAPALSMASMMVCRHTEGLSCTQPSPATRRQGLLRPAHHRHHREWWQTARLS